MRDVKEFLQQAWDQADREHSEHEKTRHRLLIAQQHANQAIESRRATLKMIRNIAIAIPILDLVPLLIYSYGGGVEKQFVEIAGIALLPLGFLALVGVVHLQTLIEKSSPKR